MSNTPKKESVNPNFPQIFISWLQIHIKFYLLSENLGRIDDLNSEVQ